MMTEGCFGAVTGRSPPEMRLLGEEMLFTGAHWSAQATEQCFYSPGTGQRSAAPARLRAHRYWLPPLRGWREQG
jgi:hypothetical protein